MLYSHADRCRVPSRRLSHSRGKTGRLARPNGRVALAAGMFLAGTALLTSRASAQFYWDPGHTPLSPSGGSGVWDYSTPNWSDGTSNTDFPWNWSPVDAVFSGQGGTVVVLGNSKIQSVTLDSGGYTFVSDPRLPYWIFDNLTQTASVTGTNVIAAPFSLMGSVHINGGTLHVMYSPFSVADQPFYVAKGATLEFDVTPTATALNHATIDLLGGTAKIDATGPGAGSIQAGVSIGVSQDSNLVLDGTPGTDITVGNLVLNSPTLLQPVSVRLDISGSAGTTAHLSGVALGRNVYATINNDIDVYTGLFQADAFVSKSVLTKTGPARLVFDSDQFDVDNTTIDVAESTVEYRAPKHVEGGLNGAALQINGGSLILNAKNGSTSFNDALIVTPTGGILRAQDSSLVLGQSSSSATINGPLAIDTAIPGGQRGNASLMIASPISGTGSLRKIGGGTLLLAPGGSFSGPTDVAEGTLNIVGSLASDITVESGATFGGSATLLGNLAFAEHGAKLAISLATTSPPGYSQLLFAQHVSLGESEVQIDDSVYSGPIGQTFWLLDGLPGSSAVSGLFTYDGNLLENGEIFTSAAGAQYRIDYNIAGDPQGTGNDVLLTVVPEPASLSLVALAAVGLLGRRTLD